MAPISSPRPGRRWVPRLVGAASAAVLIAGLAGLGTWRALASPTAEPSTATSIEDFLSTYVQPDGRVVRADQGGDTVSEGQAYGMLLAVASGNRAELDRIWGWTRANLQEPDGLLAWHWQDGKVVSTEAASDADLDAAWALALAGGRFRDSAYSDAARHIASGILAEETETVAGKLVLVAGPWARTPTPTVDPSYFSPSAYSALFDLTDQPQWHSLAVSSAAILTQLTTDPTRLPPDWAQIEADGRAVAVSAPPGSSTPGEAPSYGLDAARVELWYATACPRSPAPGATAGASTADPDRSVPAGDWPELSGTAGAQTFPIAMSLRGTSESRYDNPLIAMADAAAAAAAGKSGEADQLIADATRLDQQYPTYYGTAWLALGRVLLSTGDLRTCPLL